MGTFLLGFGVGIVGGILAAPHAGQYYRELLGTKAGEGLDYIKDKAEGLRETASGAVEKGKEAVSQHIENVAIKPSRPAAFQR